MFKIFRKNCCGLDVHKTRIYACIGITDSNNITTYRENRFPSFTKGLNHLVEWLKQFNCKEVCMESSGKYRIPAYNILENYCFVTLAHPGERFDVTPFVHGKCKHPLEEIQAAVDGAISREQAVKLRECLNHMDELEPYTSEGYFCDRPVADTMVITKSQAFTLLRMRGYVIKDDAVTSSP